MKICKYMSGIFLFIILLSGIFFGLLFCKPFYKLQYNTIAEIKFSQLSETEYVNYTMQIINYFFNNSKFISIKDSNGRKINGFFTKDEILHMADVKNLIRFFFMLFIASIPLFIICMKFVKFKIDLLRKVAFAGIVFVAVLFIISLFDFSKAFIVFHKLFFRNSLWLLPASTKLIEMFPEKFFYNFTKIWLGIFFVVNGLIYFASFSLFNS